MDAEMKALIARRKDVTHRLKRILIEVMQLDLKAEEIAEDAALFGIGMGLDSIDALQFIVGIEKEFKLTLPSEDVNLYRSVNSVADYLVSMPAATP